MMQSPGANPHSPHLPKQCSVIDPAGAWPRNGLKADARPR